MDNKDIALRMAGDALRPTRDLSELMALKAHPKPADATWVNGPDQSRRAKFYLPWLYDFAHGWTPKAAKLDPRPDLQLPPYFLGNFPLRTCGLQNAKYYFITVDLRPFPHEARVFMRLPLSIFPAEVKKNLLARRPVKVGSHVQVVRNIAEFNIICGENLPRPVTKTEVVVELVGGKRAILLNLALPTALQPLRVYYGVLRQYVAPKTYYTLQMAQFIDNRLVGSFNHLLHAHHNYDVPVIGDRRTNLAWRRSSHEVSLIPPMALMFFASWKEAQAMGYDFVPRSYGKHFKPDGVSVALADEVLKFFNARGTNADKIVKMVRDNPYLNAYGGEQRPPKAKVGIEPSTAQKILSNRATLPKNQFTRLQEIDAVKGIGPDTMSDIITSILERRITRPKPGKWEPDPRIIRLLSRKRR